MLTALTHIPSQNINNCELTYVAPAQIDLEKAMHQHQAYCAMLTSLGVEVKVLDGNRELPDSVFVEDTAVVLDEVAVITSMGADSRTKETALIERELSRFREVEHIVRPARIEGGDVLQIGNSIFVGDSSRTNKEGIEAFRNIVGPYGYTVVDVKVFGCLHLTTGCTALDERTILLNPDWIDASIFSGFDRIAVPKNEPFAGNILPVAGKICVHSGFEKTIGMLQTLGYSVVPIDISEFLKAEAALTCLSLIFNVGE